jgi:hypothetical protein
MQDRPTAAELLAAVRAFLDDELRPAVDGRLAFHARVAANALAMIERELRDGEGFAAAERDRAAALLGDDGEPAALERELARRIRDGSLDDRFAEVRDHVRATVREKLLIVNPDYLRTDADEIREIPRA